LILSPALFKATPFSGYPGKSETPLEAAVCCFISEDVLYISSKSGRSGYLILERCDTLSVIRCTRCRSKAYWKSETGFTDICTGPGK
jgi:hypothetical protein